MSKKDEKTPIQRIPTRTLLASIKQDIRKQLRAAKYAGKPLKKK
jgi:hypothetical protein